MISFLQLNIHSLISIAFLIGFFIATKYLIGKYKVEDTNPGFIKFVKWSFVFLLTVNVLVIGYKTLHNQAPKTKVDNSSVERSMSKYQQSVINNTK